MSPAAAVLCAATLAGLSVLAACSAPDAARPMPLRRRLRLGRLFPTPPCQRQAALTYCIAGNAVAAAAHRGE